VEISIFAKPARPVPQMATQESRKARHGWAGFSHLLGNGRQALQRLKAPIDLP
jgi:hypothetical protein